MRGPDHQPRREYIRDRVVGLGFLLALVVPGLLMIVGVRPENVERRTLAPEPQIRLDRLLDVSMYQEIDAYVTDSLPVRTSAVRARAEFAYAVLRSSTSSQVILGRDDWMFFRTELRPQCAMDVATMLGRIDAAADAMARSSIRLHILIVPDKHAIHPEMLDPATVDPQACTDVQREAMRAGIRARPETMVDGWAALEAGLGSDADPGLFWHQDSHWTPLGASLVVDDLLSSLQPGIVGPTDVVVRGTTRRQAELARLLGLDRTEVAPDVVVRRDVDSTRAEIGIDAIVPGAKGLPDWRSTGSAARIPGTTILIHDSFMQLAAPLVNPYFERLVWVPYDLFVAHPEIAEVLPEADRVIVARVEREAYDMDLGLILGPFGLMPAE